jgi:heme exporter protein C
MPKWFIPAAAVCFLMFMISPVLIANAPYEATMGLVQKIFYYHVPSAMTFFVAAVVCGVNSWRFLFGKNVNADRLANSAAELAVVFGAITLVTGPLWARKSWGVWWQWDVRLTSSLMMWMIFIAYLLVRKYGGGGGHQPPPPPAR